MYLISPSTVLYVSFPGRWLHIRALSRLGPTAAAAALAFGDAAASDRSASTLNVPSIFLFLTVFLWVGIVVCLISQVFGEEQ